MSEKIVPLPLFPVYLFEHDFEPPTSGTYYLVAKDGIYLHKETKAGNALLKVEGIPWLQQPDIKATLKLPKLPARIIAQALAFFRKVFDKYQSEAYVTLFYSEKLDQYRLWCPTQTVSHGSVNYDRNDQLPFAERKTDGWNMCGTIHSHCDFSAFHSGTDIGDEDSFDGFHLTLGHVNRSQISMESSSVFSGQRTKLEPENCCLGVIRTSNKELFGQKRMTYGKGDSYFFDIELTEEEAQQLVVDMETIETDWMPKVTHLAPVYGKGYYTGSVVGGFLGSKKNKKIENWEPTGLNNPSDDDDYSLRNWD